MKKLIYIFWCILLIGCIRSKSDENANNECSSDSIIGSTAIVTENTPEQLTKLTVIQGEYPYDKLPLDTVVDNWRIEVSLIGSLDPDDYAGPHISHGYDIYDRYCEYAEYHYGSRGRISINDLSKTDEKPHEFYLSRSALSDALGLKDSNKYYLSDLKFAGIQNDTITFSVHMDVHGTDSTFVKILKFAETDPNEAIIDMNNAKKVILRSDTPKRISQNNAIYLLDIRKFDKSDTVIGNVEFNVSLRTTYDPDDYVADVYGKRSMHNVYGDSICFDLYYYGNSGRVLIKDNNVRQTDTIYITRSMIYKALKWTGEKFHFIDDLVVADMRGDSIYFNVTTGAYDTDDISLIELSFNKSDIRNTMRAKDITPRSWWDYDYEENYAR